MAEIVSELVYAGKSMAEIASYTDLQLRWIVFRKRDAQGQLLRGESAELPDWVTVDADGQRRVGNPRPFKEMFYMAQKRLGRHRGQADKAWGDYMQQHPKLAFQMLFRDEAPGDVQAQLRRQAGVPSTTPR